MGPDFVRRPGCALAFSLLVSCGCATTRVDRDRKPAARSEEPATGDQGGRCVQGHRGGPDLWRSPASDIEQAVLWRIEQGTGERERQHRETSRSRCPHPTIPPPASEYPIDLSTALRLAEIENPTIAAARAAIIEALAVQTGARAILLPSLNAGTNYHNHTGNLQRSAGRILSVSEQSLYFGGGARTLAAESIGIPAVNLVGTLTEAWFEPLAARRAS